jgi:hypothetical protein
MRYGTFFIVVGSFHKLIQLKKPLSQNWDKSLDSCGTTLIRLHYTNALSSRTIMRAPLITGGVPVAPSVKMTFGLPS